MNDDGKLTAYALLIGAAVARDLDAAGLLSDATRKAIHGGLAEVRDQVVSAGTDTASGASATAAFQMLDGLAPAADG